MEEPSCKSPSLAMGQSLDQGLVLRALPSTSHLLANDEGLLGGPQALSSGELRQATFLPLRRGTGLVVKVQARRQNDSGLPWPLKNLSTLSRCCRRTDCQLVSLPPRLPYLIPLIPMCTPAFSPKCTGGSGQMGKGDQGKKPWNTGQSSPALELASRSLKRQVPPSLDASLAPAS